MAMSVMLRCVLVTYFQVTLSGLPETKWRSLSRLDVIKARNRPQQVVERKPLPFFLSKVQASGQQQEEGKSSFIFLPPALQEAGGGASSMEVDSADANSSRTQSRIVNFGDLKPCTQFVSALGEGACVFVAVFDCALAESLGCPSYSGLWEQSQ